MSSLASAMAGIQGERIALQDVAVKARLRDLLKGTVVPKRQAEEQYEDAVIACSASAWGRRCRRPSCGSCPR